MGRQLTVIPILILTVFLAGCCCDNDVCEGKESYMPSRSKSLLIEETCDDCMNVLKISSQGDMCLKSTMKFVSSRDAGEGIVPDGQKLYPYLHGQEDEWAECETFKDEDTKLKCGCCLLLDGDTKVDSAPVDLVNQYKFEGGECYTSGTMEAMMSGDKWAVVTEKDYFKDKECLG
jgi:hypothetical protein